MTNAESEDRRAAIIEFASDMLGFPVPPVCAEGLLENLGLLAEHQRILDGYLGLDGGEAQP